MRTDRVGIDTDVLLKSAAFRLSNELISVLTPKGNPAALGLTHLIAPKQLGRIRGLEDRVGAEEELAWLLSQLGTLEPDETEIETAASIVGAAQEDNLPLDTGEAQLVSILIHRQLPLLITGDKRAIGALAELLKSGKLGQMPLGRIACFEQLIKSIAAIIDTTELRNRVCNEPKMDGAISLSCSCGRKHWTPEHFHEALDSLTNEVRKRGGKLVADRSAFA